MSVAVVVMVVVVMSVTGKSSPIGSRSQWERGDRRCSFGVAMVDHGQGGRTCKARSRDIDRRGWSLAAERTLVDLATGRAVGERGGFRGGVLVRMTPMTMVMVIEVLLLCLFCLLSAFLDNLDVIVEDSSNDGDHVSLDDPSTDALSAAHPYVHNALKSEIPLPHVHHVLATSLL